MRDIIQIRDLITRYRKDHQDFLARAQEGLFYYENQNKILRTGAAAIDEVNAYLKSLGKSPLRSADNRIPTNWHRILTDQKVGYLFTYPPQFDLKGNDGDQSIPERIQDTLGEDYEKVIKQLAVDASNCGRAWLHYWYQPGGKFEYYFIDPLQVIPIYDKQSVKPVLQYLLRVYSYIDGTGKDKTRFELWDDTEVAYLEQDTQPGAQIQFEMPAGEPNIQRHSYGEIPFIEFANNGSRTGDLPMYKQLIDAIDKLISGFANDIDDIQEIIWVIRNYAGEADRKEYNEETGEEVDVEIDLRQRLKAMKFALVDENGGIDALRNEIPYEARGSFLEILINQLYISAMAVNPDPEKTGNQSGVYIDFLYSLLELKAGLMETEFRPALSRLCKAILQYLGLDRDTPIQQIWTRNKPRNDQEISQMIAQTPETVLSDETKTKVHPLTDDWQEERKRIEKEQEKRQQDAMDQWQDIPPQAPGQEKGKPGGKV